MTISDKLLELAVRVERYDPTQSPDNRAEEISLHQDIVMATGEGSLTCAFEATFVRSLDAAMSLVPEGWRFSVGDQYEGAAWASVIDQSDARPDGKSDAATPALALCAASLRARASQESSL